MNREDTIKLLNMSYYLMHKTEDDVAESVARDLYDFAIDKTEDKDIQCQAQLGRAEYKDRLKTIRYLNHRLNLGIHA